MGLRVTDFKPFLLEDVRECAGGPSFGDHLCGVARNGKTLANSEHVTGLFRGLWVFQMSLFSSWFGAPSFLCFLVPHTVFFPLLMYLTLSLMEQTRQ